MSDRTHEQWIEDNNSIIDDLIVLANSLDDGQSDLDYKELFDIASSIYNNGIPDDSATAIFDIDEEQVCLQKALDILRGRI